MFSLSSVGAPTHDVLMYGGQQALRCSLSASPVPDPLPRAVGLPETTLSWPTGSWSVSKIERHVHTIQASMGDAKRRATLK